MATPTRHRALPQGYPKLLQPPAATALHTSDEGLEAGGVWIPVHDGEIPAYRAMPARGGALPILLVVQEVFGVDEYLQDVCRRAARAGFVAIAPELCARHGAPGEAASREELFKIVFSTPDAEVLADLDACVRWAADSGCGDAKRTAITGFCWGGRIVWLYASHRADLRAGVAWYGRLTAETDSKHPRHPLDVAGSLHAPVLGLYGSADEGIPLDGVEAMKKKLAEAHSPSEFIVYDGAPHAFHADYRPSYRADVAADGWERMLAWFRTHVRI